MSFKLEITGNEKIEEALKQLCATEQIKTVGMELYYTKVDLDKYNFFCIIGNPILSVQMKVGKKLVISEMKKKFREADPTCEIKEVKV